MSRTVVAESPVRVLIVDDSAFMRQSLSQMIASEPDFEVVGTAFDGNNALEKIAAVDPDVVTLDLEMPGLGGLDTLRCIMDSFPRPVIIISAFAEKDAPLTLEALSSGAFDCLPKQLCRSSLEIGHIRRDLLARLHAAGRLRRSQTSSTQQRRPPLSVPVHSCQSFALAAVAIGASTGGPHALEQILPALPQEFPAPILIVQHMPPGFTADFSRRLNSLCAIEVREAACGDVIQPGVAYIAPAGLHLRVVQHRSSSIGILTLDPEPSHTLHIPSVDVLMISVAETYGHRALGVILTGMGADGAEGMAAIHRRGGITIGQDQNSCAVYGMPRVCAELGVLSYVLPLSDISHQLVETTRRRKHA